MNKRKWVRQKDPSILVNKLAEETGEVAKAYLDVYEGKTRIARTAARVNLAEELGHVEFIAGRIREVMGLGT